MFHWNINLFERRNDDQWNQYSIPHSIHYRTDQCYLLMCSFLYAIFYMMTIYCYIKNCYVAGGRDLILKAFAKYVRNHWERDFIWLKIMHHESLPKQTGICCFYTHHYKTFSFEEHFNLYNLASLSDEFI